MQRVFHPVAVHFKGKGFYNTDYGTKRRNRELRDSAESGADKYEAKQKEKAKEAKSSDSSSTSSNGTASAAKAEKKPAAKKPAKKD